jgi:hypothetical protein
MPDPANPDPDAGNADIDALARTIAQQLPGWRLARQQVVSDAHAQQAIRGAARGASLEELRKKFLPADEASDSARDGGGSMDAPSGNRRSVLIEPEAGGPSKVIDIVDGKVKMVQG